ncbi:hypothetical protein VFA_002045 [Vibrio furnissii CIP 102972]|nr:hypothetical protein VFA_002045 [Vibrio furnissii CIP 102972]
MVQIVEILRRCHGIPYVTLSIPVTSMACLVCGQKYSTRVRFNTNVNSHVL